MSNYCTSVLHLHHTELKYSYSNITSCTKPLISLILLTNHYIVEQICLYGTDGHNVYCYSCLLQNMVPRLRPNSVQFKVQVTMVGPEDASLTLTGASKKKQSHGTFYCVTIIIVQYFIFHVRFFILPKFWTDGAFSGKSRFKCASHQCSCSCTCCQSWEISPCCF